MEVDLDKLTLSIGYGNATDEELLALIARCRKAEKKAKAKLEVVFAKATPVARNAALEDAAKVVECWPEAMADRDELIVAILKLKEKPHA